jgi:hypothetical protein
MKLPASPPPSYKDDDKILARFLTLQKALARRTSSASLAMKKPTVFATIFTPRGLIMIFEPLPA